MPVFDPLGAGLISGWESSGNNATGTSTWVEMSSMINVLRKITPVESFKQYDILINMKTANKIKLQIPDKVIEIATKVIQ